MTTTQAISAKILAAVESGMTVDQAIDSVCGEGTYAKLAVAVYNELTAA